MIINTFHQSTIMAICLLCLSSCASPYLGRYIDTNNEAVCNFQNLPASCTWTTEDFSISYQIEETGKVGEYKVSGSAQNTGGQTYNNYLRATFDLLLVHNNTVIEHVGMAGGAGDVSLGIPFKRTFSTPQDFDASLMGYSMQLRGQ